MVALQSSDELTVNTAAPAEDADMECHMTQLTWLVWANVDRPTLRDRMRRLTVQDRNAREIAGAMMVIAALGTWAILHARGGPQADPPRTMTRLRS